MRDLLTLIGLGIVTGFAVLEYGGVTPHEWTFVLAGVILLSLIVWLPGRAIAFAPSLTPASAMLMAAVPLYVGLQLVPLPLSWLSILSPERAELVRGLAPIYPSNWAQLTVSPPTTVVQLMRVIAYILVFFLVRELGFRVSDRVWSIAIPVVTIATIEAAIGLAQHFTAGTNASGTYVDPDHFAGLLEMALPLAVAFLLIQIDRARLAQRETLRAGLRICLPLACGLAILLGLMYSNSRMSLGAAAASMAVLGFFGLHNGHRRGGRASLIAGSAGFIFLVLAAPLSLLQRYSTGLTTESRIAIWKDTLSLIRSYPLFGCGFGTFASAFQKYSTSSTLALVDFAHNDYLQLLAELGAAGFVLIAALGALLSRDALLASVREPHPARRIMAIACTASLAAIVVHSTVEFQFYIPANAMVAAWVAGLASGIQAGAMERTTWRPHGKT